MVNAWSLTSPMYSCAHWHLKYSSILLKIRLYQPSKAVALCSETFVIQSTLFILPVISLMQFCDQKMSALSGELEMWTFKKSRKLEWTLLSMEMKKASRADQRPFEIPFLKNSIPYVLPESWKTWACEVFGTLPNLVLLEL